MANATVDTSNIGGEGTNSNQRPGHQLMYAYERSEGEQRVLRMEGDALIVRIEPPVNQSVALEASNTDQAVSVGAGMLNTVINASTEQLSVYDGVIEGQSNQLIAVLLPGTTMAGPIAIANGIVIRSASALVSGIVTALFT